jgi:L-glyceraldehyde 3-phosphate reductase
LFNRRIELDVLPASLKTNTGVVAFSPLAQGLLSEKYLHGFPEESRAAKMWTPAQREIVGPAVRQRILQLSQVAKARGQTLPQMALSWILRRPEITTALIGASDVTQVEENVKALENLTFSPEELGSIDKALAT